MRATAQIGIERAAARLAVSLAALLAAAAVAAPAGLEEREIAVYSALINHGLGGDVPLVVVAARTTGDPAALADHADAPAMVADLGAPPETLANWEQRNAVVQTVDLALDLDASYLVIDDDTRGALFDGVEPDVGWQRFFERYAGAPGLLRLSRAGFNHTLNHALVYIEHHCGADCGSGRLTHLALGDAGRWEVVSAALVWMAE